MNWAITARCDASHMVATFVTDSVTADSLLPIVVCHCLLRGGDNDDAISTAAYRCCCHRCRLLLILSPSANCCFFTAVRFLFFYTLYPLSITITRSYHCWWIVNMKLIFHFSCLAAAACWIVALLHYPADFRKPKLTPRTHLHAVASLLPCRCYFCPHWLLVTFLLPVDCCLLTFPCCRSLKSELTLPSIA